MPKTRAKKVQFKVLLTVGQDVYTVKGPSLLAALSKVQLKNNPRGYATIQIETGERDYKIPIKINPLRLKRIFLKEWELVLFAKRLTTLL